MTSAEHATGENPLIADHIDFESRLEETRAQVWSLLHYAMSDANKDVTANRPDLIEKVLPGLKKRAKDMSEVDIANLFAAYNELSQMVYPATVESLWLKRQIEVDERNSVLEGAADVRWWKSLLRHLSQSKAGNGVSEGNFREQKRESTGRQVQSDTGTLKFWLYWWGAIIILLQAYTLVLSFKLEVVGKTKNDLVAIEREIASAKSAIASSGNQYVEEHLNKFPLHDLFVKRLGIIQTLDNHFCVLHKDIFIWPLLYSSQGIDCELGFDTTDRSNGQQIKTPAGAGTEAQSEQTNDLAIENDKGKPEQKAASGAGKELPPAAKIIYADEKQQSLANATREAFFACAEAVLRVLNYLLLPTLLGLLGALAFVIRELLKNYAQASYVIGSRRNRQMRIVLGPLLGLISGIIAYPSREAFTQAAFSPLIFGFLMGYSVEFAFSLFDSLIAKGKSLLPDLIVSPKQATGGTPIGAEVPQIFKLDPAQGPKDGGNRVVISGKGFGKDAKVKFGDTAANVENIEDSQITVTPPPGEGMVNVVVQTSGGTSLSRPESQYSYIGEGDTHACDAGTQGQAITLDEELPAAQGGVEQ